VIFVTAALCYDSNNRMVAAKGDSIMRNGSDAFEYAAPILVLGLGDDASGDDGLGAVLLAQLAKRYRYAGHFVNFMAGGTRGLDLLGEIAGRPAVVILDAVATGTEPGAVCVLEGADALRYATANSPVVHPGDVRELLSTAAFLGDLPDQFCLVGVRPGEGSAKAVLSKEVEQALQRAVSQAQAVVDRFLVELAEPVSA
jgi:hydrogenase maturation protease